MGHLPIFAGLSGYEGDLDPFLASTAGPAHNATSVEGKPVKKAYVFDGLDEIPAAYVHEFLSELDGLLSREPNASFVLTCRQADYEDFRHDVPTTFQEFFPLGFDGADIRTYATQRGQDPDNLGAELERTDLWLEASVPFVLKTLVDVIALGHQLENTRSDNLALVADGLLEKRTRVGAPKQRRALETLGLAMEIYSRNELTMDEAARVLSYALTIEDEEAHHLVDELSQSILLRTSSGIRFQLRSFGEYFAASKLENADLGRVLSYAQLRNTIVLNPTWANTISYLIEINPQVRNYFVKQEPEWVLPSSPAVFSASQRQQVTRHLFDKLADGGHYLLSDRAVDHHRLARLLTPEDAEWLRPHLDVPDPVQRANAIVLLAHLKETSLLDQVLELALDRTGLGPLRQAAIIAIGCLGSAELIPRLLVAAHQDDPLQATLIDLAGSLTTPETLAQVLDNLPRAAMFLPAAAERIAATRTRGMLDAALGYFLARQEQSSDRTVASYVKPVWNLLEKYNDDTILAKIGVLLASCARRHMYAQDMAIFPDLLRALNGHDPKGIISQTALQATLDEGLMIEHIVSAVAPLCTPQTARWLLEQNPSQKLIRYIALHANSYVRKVLLPAVDVTNEALEEARAQHRREESERVSRETDARTQRQQTIRTSGDIIAVLNAFINSAATELPELDNHRKAWLGAEVSRTLAEADPLHKVQWVDEFRISFPQILHPAVALASHYGLPLEDDAALVHATLALAPDLLTEYHRKTPLSARAMSEIERMLNDPALPSPALPYFISLVDHFKLESPSVHESLSRVAVSQDANEINRRMAADALARSACSDDILIAGRKRTEKGGIQTIFLNALTDRKHLPTICERLNRLMAKDEDLGAQEAELSNPTLVQWIANIRIPEAWRQLANLRLRALQLCLPNLARLAEAALAGIDKTRLVHLIEEQLSDTPEAWREYTRLRIADYRLEIKFDQARSITFEEVLARLKQAEGAYRTKLICEGVTDEPVFRALLDRKGLASVAISSIGGWSNVLNPHFNIAGHIDGFHFVVFVLDADKGRDLNAPERPIKPGAQGVIDKIEHAGAPVRIVRRYGIENYFTQAALEKVLEKDLSGSFPLDETRPISHQISGYNKNDSDKVIQSMSASDLAGTDLAEILDEFAAHVQSSSS